MQTGILSIATVIYVYAFGSPFDHATGLGAKKIPIMGDEQHRASYWDRRDIKDQIHGLLKSFGLVIGRTKMNTFSLRAQDSPDDRPELAATVEPWPVRGRRL